MRMDSETGIREWHDRIAKRLFGRADIVSELLRCCLPEGTLPAFDASTLKRFPEEQVDSQLKLRRADTAWELALPDGTRVVVLIEAQSSPDAAMASRMAGLCIMVCEPFLRRGEPVPRLLPLVFYTGKPPWRAAADLRQGADNSPGLLAFLSEKCYLLLDAKRLSSSQLPEGDRMSLIVGMASAEGEVEARDVLKRARRRWARDDPEFCLDLAEWAYRANWLTRLEQADRKEVTMTLEERAREYEEFMPDVVELFKLRGMERGMQQGMEQATRDLRAQERSRLGHQAARKFGPRAEKSLGDYLSRFNTADDYERAWGWIVDCRSESELLSKLREANGAH